MNVIQAIQDYISKMISNIPGIKVLLLDRETTGIVSMTYSQSQILQKEVYLFERIDAKNRELMAHLKAVCFLRPTVENFELLEQELRDPKYGEYHIFFSNSVPNAYIEQLAGSDEHEVVQQMQEFFADYYPITTELFTLNLDHVISLHQPQWKDISNRILDGLTSALLSLKKQPYIRYAVKSEMAQKLVQDLQRRISQEPGLYDFRKQDIPPLLLVLDRRDDPVTPLLTQWTYQAMVHELFGISNNRVSLKGVPGIKKDLQEIVLSTEQDPWFKQTAYLNFGDLGVKVKELVDDYQQKTKSNQHIETIEDIKQFVENYPEFKKLSGNVTKHVTLMSELSRIVESRSLLQVSEVEQAVANASDHSGHLKMIKEVIDNPKISKEDKVRITLLYTLRYETHSSNEISQLIDLLSKNGIPQEQIGLTSAIIQYAGANIRGGDVFSNRDLGSSLKRRIKRGLKGVDNIYTEHKPLLKEILELVLANKLKENQYPFFFGSQTKEPPQDIIVFIVGGVTFEEALTVHEFNTSNTSGARIILGGTAVHNSKSFLEDVASIRSISYRSQ